MGLNRKYLPLLFLSIFCVFLVTGCVGTTKSAIRLHSDFSEKNVDTIVLMPIVDRRIDKSGAINIEKNILRPSKKMLEKKGYYVITPDSFLEGENISPEEVGEMDVEELAMLGPDGSKTLLFVYIEDVIDSYAIVAYTFKIEATSSLIEKSGKVELWRDKGIGASGQGGLISGPFAGMDKSAAISTCLRNMFTTLPDAPSKR